MATGSAHREVTVGRIANGRFCASNSRGGQITIGTGAVLPDAVKKSHDRLRTVGRTVELGTPVATRIE